MAHSTAAMASLSSSLTVSSLLRAGLSAPPPRRGVKAARGGLLARVSQAGGRAAVLSRRRRTCRCGGDDFYVDDDGTGLVDAPVSAGDGFSFAGGKYSDQTGPFAEWAAKGRQVKTSYGKAQSASKGGPKDPIFGLAMGSASADASGEKLTWFCVEEGSASSPPAYSYREVFPVLSNTFRCIAVDWPGFGFSDKPQPGEGFNYTLEEFTSALSALVDELQLSKFALVVQGYLAPAGIAYATANPQQVSSLAILNAPLTQAHAKQLPGPLAAFARPFMFGDILAQDPIRASDGILNACGPYVIDEQTAMVYRRPYLSSGMAGFALAATLRSLKGQMPDACGKVRQQLSGGGGWDKPTLVAWGMKDKWLSFDGVEEFAKSANAELVRLEKVGHHAQEDYGELVGKTLLKFLK
eukprot:jgi/Chlat1/6483/Chrsp45S06059